MLNELGSLRTDTATHHIEVTLIMYHDTQVLQALKSAC